MAKKLADIRTCPEWVHQELMNWSRWCWAGAYPHPMPPTQCASIEGGYSRFGEDTPTEPDDYKPIPPNAQRAEIVQAAWEIMPADARSVLRAEYPQRYQSTRAHAGQCGAARWLRMSLKQYEAALAVAQYRVMLAFGGNNEVRKGNY